MGNFNPIQPTKYQGTNKYISFFVSRNRQPTLADYRQPETGTLYSIGTLWQVSKDPITGTEGEVFLLQKIVSNQAYWALISNGSFPGGPILSLSDTLGTFVYPNISGNVQLEGSIGIFITSDPANNKIQFVLPGGGQSIESLLVDANTAPGTNPVIPSNLGVITITGSQVATGIIGANVIRTNSLLAHTYAIEIQQSSTSVSKDVSKNGVSHFNDNQFTDDEGFISLKGGGPTNTAFFIATISSDVLNVTGDNTAYFVVFNTESVDVGGNYNTSTGKFTAPVDGYYEFITSLLLGGLSASHTTGKFNFTKNSVEVGSAFRGNFSQIADAGANFAASCSCILELNAGDEIQVLLQVDGAAKDVDLLTGGGNSLSNFQGYIIRQKP